MVRGSGPSSFNSMNYSTTEGKYGSVQKTLDKYEYENHKVLNKNLDVISDF